MDNRQLVEFSVDWASRLATHRDRRVLACELNQQPVGPFQGLVGCLKQAAAEGVCRETFAPGTLLPDRDPALVRHIPRARFDAHFAGQHTQPAVGRYYPKAMIAGALGCSRRELAPFHLIGMEGEQLVVDLNHPLAGLELNLSARKRDQPAAGSVPLVDAAAIPQALVENGPGMQAGADRAEASFFAAYPFTREDPQEDALFYRNPRLVPHLDATASAEVSAIYSRFLEPGMRVLDLMSSWVSHLPVSKNDISLTGLGMNRQELASNTLLNDYLIHDLNRSPALPFEDRAFDLVICTASVEYLSSPIGVFREIARVLKPGGRFVNTFSNRWFPPKAIQLWAQLHPFERMGLVLDFYRRAEAYDDLHTESVQGLPRPENDKYAGRIALSDPVFAVWARRAQA